MYIAGTTNSVKTVPIEIPEAITRPMLNRLTAPAPEAVMRGITPRTIAAVVMRMGRKRMLAAGDPERAGGESFSSGRAFARGCRSIGFRSRAL